MVRCRLAGLTDDQHVARRAANDLRADRAERAVVARASPDDDEVGAGRPGGLDDFRRDLAARLQVTGDHPPAQHAITREFHCSTFGRAGSPYVNDAQARAVPDEIGSGVERSVRTLGAVVGDDDPSRVR